MAKPHPDPGDDNADPPIKPKPTAAASLPAIGLQIRSGFGANAGCLAPADAETLRRTIEDRFRTQFPQVDVRSACVTTRDRVTATTIGVWPQPSAPGGSDARDLGLRELDAIDPAEQIAIFVHPGFIGLQVEEQFSKIPKRYSSRAVPQDDGPIHITGKLLRFVPGGDVEGRVVLDVFGFDEDPVPDVTFTQTFTDILKVIPPDHSIISDAQDPVLDKDVGLLNVITSVAAGLVTLAFPPSLVFTGDVLTAALKPPSGPPIRPGIGAAIVASFFPKAVLLPGTDKLELRYTRIAVSDQAIVGAGITVRMPRAPSCKIVGPRRVQVDVRESAVSADFSIQPFDLRGDLSVTWNGDGVTANSNGARATLTFALHDQKVGRVLHVALDARVVDVDGLVATAQVTVEIQFVNDDDPRQKTPARASPG